MRTIRDYRRARIDRVVADIALHPGMSRKELAHKYYLSVRQLQADFDVIREVLGLPLVRRGGYRFDEACGQRALSITNGVMVIRIAFRMAGPEVLVA